MAGILMQVSSSADSDDGEGDGEPSGTRVDILEASAMESRQKRYGDMGHLLPMSSTSRTIQGTQLMRSAAEGPTPACTHMHTKFLRSHCIQS